MDRGMDPTRKRAIRLTVALTAALLLVCRAGASLAQETDKLVEQGKL